MFVDAIITDLDLLAEVMPANIAREREIKSHSASI
jgi:hypothetical protein